MVMPDRGTKLRQGKRQGQAALRPDPPLSEDCNGCEDDAPKGKTQERKRDIKGEPTASCRIGVIDGDTKPDQYDCCVFRLGNGAARAARGQAFLRPILLQPS